MKQKRKLYIDLAIIAAGVACLVVMATGADADAYDNELEAMTHAGATYFSATRDDGDIRVGSIVKNAEGSYSYYISRTTPKKIGDLVPEGGTLAAVWYTRGEGSTYGEYFTANDMRIVDNLGVTVYMISTGGNLKTLKPGYTESRHPHLKRFKHSSGDLVFVNGAKVYFEYE